MHFQKEVACVKGKKVFLHYRVHTTYVVTPFQKQVFATTNPTSSLALFACWAEPVMQSS